MNDVSDLWTKELITKNQIKQVIFLPSRGDTILSNYRIDGQVEIEYLIDKEDKDTSIVFYTYDDGILKEKLHLSRIKDTITHTRYKYEKSKLKKVIEVNPTFQSKKSNEYFYDKKGNLKRIESKYLSEYRNRESAKYFGELERLEKEIEWEEGTEKTTQYFYEDNKVKIENEEGNTTIFFNKKGFPISHETDKENHISFELIYDEKGLLKQIEADGKIEAEVKYVKRKK